MPCLKIGPANFRPQASGAIAAISLATEIPLQTDNRETPSQSTTSPVSTLRMSRVLVACGYLMLGMESILQLVTCLALLNICARTRRQAQCDPAAFTSMTGMTYIAS